MQVYEHCLPMPRRTADTTLLSATVVCAALHTEKFLHMCIALAGLLVQVNMNHFRAML